MPLSDRKVHAASSGLEKLVQTISQKAGMEEEKVRKLIEEKQDELSGLVSEEGAAYIVGRELGVALLKEEKREFKVKNLISGLRSVDLVIRIIKVSEEREFERKGKKGRVVSLLLGDETGIVRLPLWNEEIERAGSLKEGDVIKITGAYVVTDSTGNIELRLGRGNISRSDQKVSLPEIQDLEQLTVARRKAINELKEGDFGEVRACLVQIFKRNPFYETCPNCGSRLKNQEGTWVCPDHGPVEPQFQMVVSGVLDDGFGNIRAVFFRDMASRIFGKTAQELREIAQKETDPLAVYEHFDGLGKELIFRGRVKRNDFTENLEFVVNDIREIDIKKEAEEMLKKLNVKK